MVPRVTTVRRVHVHPNATDLWVVHVRGSEHQVVVPLRHVAQQMHVGDDVLYLPLDVALPEDVAVALGVQRQCDPCERLIGLPVSSQWRQAWNVLRTSSIDMLPTAAAAPAPASVASADGAVRGDRAAAHRRGGSGAREAATLMHAVNGGGVSRKGSNDGNDDDDDDDKAMFTRVFHRKTAKCASQFAPIYYRVTAQKLCGTVSCGIVLPLDTAKQALLANGSPLSAPSSSSLAALSSAAVSSSALMRAMRFVPVRPSPPPLVDLLQNPALLRTLLDTPVWMSERISGRAVTLHYDACANRVRYWDETRVTAPYAWWTLGNEDHGDGDDDDDNDAAAVTTANGGATPSPRTMLSAADRRVKRGARELSPDCSTALLLERFAPAVERVGRERYAQAIDVYMRGIVCANGAVYFYECALHGARSFVLSAEQFLRLCETARLPRVPTLYANRTLRSIVNERLGRRRPLLPAHDAATAAPSRALRARGGGDDDVNNDDDNDDDDGARVHASGGGGGGGIGHGAGEAAHDDNDDDHDDDDNVGVHKHVYDYSRRHTDAPPPPPSSSARKAPYRERDATSDNTSASASSSCSWRRSTPIDARRSGGCARSAGGGPLPYRAPSSSRQRRAMHERDGGAGGRGGTGGGGGGASRSAIECRRNAASVVERDALLPSVRSNALLPSVRSNALLTTTTTTTTRRRQTDVDATEDDTDSRRFGGVAHERVDWARCLMIIANHLSDRSREHSRNVIGFVLQVYGGGDAARLLERFQYMRYRVGAQVLCEHELLQRGGVVRLL